jgi:autotransporter-associated beta strand protein
LIANAGTGGGGGGGIFFQDQSSGGTSQVEVFGNRDFGSGYLDIIGVSGSLTIGSLEGTGLVFLGANNLTVGSNNLSRFFSGVIQDGYGPGTLGGSLSKIGSGTLTLSHANTYTGGTTINKGVLVVKNVKGSATGPGAVQVNLGTLRGIGKIDGAVTVGTGSSSGVILVAGDSASPGILSPGILTINNALTFQTLSTYKCVLDRTAGKASQVIALGVIINSGATFAFVDRGIGTLPIGTVFAVIKNTSASPIAGTFSNRPNGSIFTSNGNKFKVNYTGGTGNDLTLKVVP